MLKSLLLNVVLREQMRPLQALPILPVSFLLCFWILLVNSASDVVITAHIDKVDALPCQPVVGWPHQGKRRAFNSYSVCFSCFRLFNSHESLSPMFHVFLNNQAGAVPVLFKLFLRRF